MRFTVLCLVLFSSLFIACGGAPDKTVDRDQLDRNADRADRDLQRNFGD